MSRQLKRVPLDFSWPMNQIWKGYLNPYSSQKCNPCNGHGLNEKSEKLSNEWYGFHATEWIYQEGGRRYNNKAWQYHLTQDEVDGLIKKGRLMDFTRVPINEKQRKIVAEKIKNGGNSWLPFDNGYRPTAEKVNEWAKKGFGHDGLNQSICLEIRAKRLGIWGYCQYCNGNGSIWQSNKIEKLAEDWKPIEPPKGKGFQLWENCTEGSPVSPVFKTLDGLCTWAENNATTFASMKATKEEWKKMLKDNYVYHKEGNVVFI